MFAAANGKKSFAQFPLIRLSSINPVTLHPTILNCLSLLSVSHRLKGLLWWGLVCVGGVYLIYIFTTYFL